jgi:hypothetical protein
MHGLAGPAENPDLPSCAGSFLQSFREHMRDFHVVVELNLNHFPDEAIHVFGLDGEDDGVT